MDCVTHALTGAVLADATGARRRFGARAVWFGAAVAAWPDIDMLLSLPGRAAAGLFEHRGLTHAWITWLVLSPVIGWWAWRYMDADVRAARSTPNPDLTAPPRPAPPGGRALAAWIAFTALAYASHILLDITNAYGTMVWWPFSRARATVNAMPIIDIPFTGGLFLTWLACRWLHRWRRATEPGRYAGSAWGLALFATVALGLYAVDGMRLNGAVQREAEAQLTHDDQSFAHVRAIPLMATNRLWRIVVVDTAGHRIGVAVHSAWAPRPMAFRWYPSLDDAQRARLADNPAFAEFERFTHGIYSVAVADDGATWMLSDRRHGMLSDPDRAVFSDRATFDDAGACLGVERLRMRNDFTLSMAAEEFRRTWRLFWRGETGDAGIDN